MFEQPEEKDTAIVLINGPANQRACGNTCALRAQEMITKTAKILWHLINSTDYSLDCCLHPIRSDGVSITCHCCVAKAKSHAVE